jgi:hypothetical protein
MASRPLRDALNNRRVSGVRSQVLTMTKKTFVPYFEKPITCPAGREMRINLVTGRKTVTIPKLLSGEPLDIDRGVHCYDCSIDGCMLMGTLNKERG